MTRRPRKWPWAQDYLTTYGERAAFVVCHALEAAKAVDFPIQTFGGTKNFLPRALAVWAHEAEAEEAQSSPKLPLPLCGVNSTLFVQSQLRQQPRPMAAG